MPARAGHDGLTVRLVPMATKVGGGPPGSRLDTVHSHEIRARGMPCASVRGAGRARRDRPWRV